MEKQKPKFGKTKPREVIIPILFIFMIVGLAAFGMRIAEERLINKTLASEEVKMIDPPVSFSEINKNGYLKKGMVLGVKATQIEQDYKAELTKKLFPSIRIFPRKALTFWVDFKNTGAKTWYNSGDNFIALNVSGPAGRTSPFRHEYWQEYYYRPGRLLQSEVAPGQTGRFIFALKAPDKPGNYTEKFGLVAENKEWIEGGEFEIPIDVVASYKAELVGATAQAIKIEPGKALTFWFDFRNRGTTTWYNSGDNFIALNVSGPAGRISSFRHEYWQEYYYRPSRLLQSEVAPGEIGRFVFALKAPETEGNYEESFGLVAENMEWIQGGEVSVPIEVVDNGKYFPPAISYSEGEPDIRIGLYDTNEKVRIKATGPYNIKDSNKVLRRVNGKESSVEYIKGKYVVKAPGYSKTLSSYPRFVPENKEVIMEVITYKNFTAWDASINDNKFRGTIEVQYSIYSRKLWVINELPLETYLRGLGEASGDQPKEYLKALITAARTYAMWHIQTGGLKHNEDNFILDDSANDQIYKGYNIELRSPEITEVATNTSGKMVTYKDDIVITPYFSHSDGRTRSWTEVWGGKEKPWLVSVSDPWCFNLDLWGHGVGLSGLGARTQAEEGKTWQQILKYYYTGIEVKKIY